MLEALLRAALPLAAESIRRPRIAAVDAVGVIAAIVTGVIVFLWFAARFRAGLYDPWPKDGAPPSGRGADAPAEPSPAAIKDRGIFKGRDYIVYANGEVDGMTLAGWRRFPSLDAFKDFVS